LPGLLHLTGKKHGSQIIVGAFGEFYALPDTARVSFHGWNSVSAIFDWQLTAGSGPFSHIVWHKGWSSRYIDFGKRIENPNPGPLKILHVSGDNREIVPPRNRRDVAIFNRHRLTRRLELVLLILGQATEYDGILFRVEYRLKVIARLRGY
jgi:hypothetical protein